MSATAIPVTAPKKAPFKYYYFLASVCNATSPAVRTLTSTQYPKDAFASAAISLCNYGFKVTNMQEITEAQYYAGNAAPLAYQVEVQKDTNE